MDSLLSLWQLILGLAVFSVPGIISIARLYTRVELIEFKVRVVEPMQQQLNRLELILARIEVGLEGTKIDPPA